METSPPAANQIGLIIAFVVIVLVFVAVIWAAVTQRRKEEHLEAILFQLGFSLASPPPPQLAQTIIELRGAGPHKSLELKDVFRRSIAGGELYLFDVLDTGGSETATEAERALAVVSPSLDLPRFILIPRPDFGGRATGVLAQLAERALTWATSRTGLEEITFEGDLEFNEAFITLVREPEAVRSFLTDRRRTEVLQMSRRYVLDAVGNTLLISRNPVEREQAPDAMEQIRETQEDAERLLSRFQDGPIRYT